MERTRRETVAALLTKQVVVPEWMAKAVEGLDQEALVDVHVVEAPFGTYVLGVSLPPPTPEANLCAADRAREVTDESCPSCWCMPGEGRTPGCTDPDGCGYFADASPPTPLHAERKR